MSVDRLLDRRASKSVVALAVLVTLGSAGAAAQDQKSPASAAKPAAPKRTPIYDTKADTRVALAAATARAQRDATRVLVMFGFNECPWCHKLHEVLGKDAAIRKLARDEYTLLMVDIQAPHVDELLSRCKAALTAEEFKRGFGYPFLAVLDGAGKVVTAQRTDCLEVGDHHDPEKVKAFLAKWAAEPRDAHAVVAEALARAAADDRAVFLHFGAPWCGWCHKLDDFLARAEVAAIVARDYVDVKVDVDRMKNGKDVMDRYTHGKQGGIPWFVIVDSAGKPLATSDGPRGNIGYPGEPEEIDHYLGMLKTTARRIEPAQLDTLRKTLETEAARIKTGAGH
jgi:thioredoxin-related protein